MKQEEPNLNPAKNLEKEKMLINFSEKEIDVDIKNLSLQKEGDHSKEFVIEFGKESIALEREKTYANYVTFDKETENMLSVVKKVSQYNNLPEKEQLQKILEILRNYVKYPFPKDIENMKQKDEEMAKWMKYINDDSRANLSDVFEKGYGICGHLSVAYLYLVEKMGLKGIIVFGDQIKNINRSDNDEPLFKSVKVGEPGPFHFWCEIQLSNGEWIPVDPSTKLFGEGEGFEDFKKANYVGKPNKFPGKEEINSGLNCPVKINFLPGEKTGKAICSVIKTQPFVFKNQPKKDFVPYNGDCKLKIKIIPEEEIDFKLKIENVYKK